MTKKNLIFDKFIQSLSIVIINQNYYFLIIEIINFLLLVDRFKNYQEIIDLSNIIYLILENFLLFSLLYPNYNRILFLLPHLLHHFHKFLMLILLSDSV